MIMLSHHMLVTPRSSMSFALDRAGSRLANLIAGNGPLETEGFSELPRPLSKN